MYRTERNYENLNKGIFPGAGRFDIPILRPELTTAENWISFNYAKGCEDPSEHGVHFFVDDYQFNRIWAHPDNYLGMMARFDTVCTPDFSTYTDFPRIIQIYNHYRKHWRWCQFASVSSTASECSASAVARGPAESARAAYSGQPCA